MPLASVYWYWDVSSVLDGHSGLILYTGNFREINIEADGQPAQQPFADREVMFQMENVPSETSRAKSTREA